nr:unnamed protein product [Callosobruchus chinensis]CAH7752155.1 unnamed protein product [Callosobruchus chinensis]
MPLVLGEAHPPSEVDQKVLAIIGEGAVYGDIQHRVPLFVRKQQKVNNEWVIELEQKQIEAEQKMADAATIIANAATVIADACKMQAEASLKRENNLENIIDVLKELIKK